MAQDKNPFESFGLNPQMVAELSERELFGVIKAMYRAILKAVHPDVSYKNPKKSIKNQQKSIEINLAFESLNFDKDPDSFRKYRKAFVARRPKSIYKKTLELQQQINALEDYQKRLSSVYLDYILEQSGWNHLNPLKPAQLSGANIYPFPLKGLKLGLLDVAINQNLKMASWSLGSNYKQIQIDHDGQISIKLVGRRKFNTVNYIHLLGAISTDSLDILPLLEKSSGDFFKAPALNASIGAHGPSISVLNRISQEKFKNHAIMHLNQHIMEKSYLFSLNKAEFEETACLTLEGLIVKIEHI